MNQDLLLPNEKLITQSDNKVITLTSHRIRYTNSIMGKSHLISIVLSDISTIEVKYTSKISLLYISIFSLVSSIVGLITNQSDIFFPLIILSIITGLIYLRSRIHVISISAKNGHKILFHTKGLSKVEIDSLINKVEGMKLGLTN